MLNYYFLVFWLLFYLLFMNMNTCNNNIFLWKRRFECTTHTQTQNQHDNIPLHKISCNLTSMVITKNNKPMWKNREGKDDAMRL